MIERAFYAIRVSIGAIDCTTYVCPPAEGPGVMLCAAGMLVLKYSKTCGPMRAGDLVFFRPPDTPRHVGI